MQQNNGLVPAKRWHDSSKTKAWFRKNNGIGQQNTKKRMVPTKQMYGSNKTKIAGSSKNNGSPSLDRSKKSDQSQKKRRFQQKMARHRQFAGSRQSSCRSQQNAPTGAAPPDRGCSILSTPTVAVSSIAVVTQKLQHPARCRRGWVAAPQTSHP